MVTPLKPDPDGSAISKLGLTSKFSLIGCVGSAAGTAWLNQVVQSCSSACNQVSAGVAVAALAPRLPSSGTIEPVIALTTWSKTASNPSARAVGAWATCASPNVKNPL